MRDTLSTDDFYDDERIRFQGSGLDAAYGLLYPRDKKVITDQIMDLVDVPGLAALWIDNGSITIKRTGQIKGRYSREEYDAIAKALRRHGIDCSLRWGGPYPFALDLSPFAMENLARLIRPYAHFSMKAKLQLRKSPLGSGQTRSQPTDREANALLRRVG